MGSRTTITEDDQGKPVVVGDETVGRIVSVEGGTAYVAPDPGVTETVLSKLGWSEASEADYPLQEEAIETITDDEIRLGSSV